MGDGPARRELESLATALGVDSRCHFLGFRPHGALDAVYAEAGVFVFPSVRESGGAVVLEAMAHGLPCLVADWGGPAVYTAGTGIHLSVESPEALVGDLVRNVEELLADPARGAEIGRRSREVVRATYLWSSKARAIDALARAAIADRT